MSQTFMIDAASVSIDPDTCVFGTSVKLILPGGATEYNTTIPFVEQVDEAGEFVKLWWSANTANTMANWGVPVHTQTSQSDSLCTDEGYLVDLAFSHTTTNGASYDDNFSVFFITATSCADPQYTPCTDAAYNASPADYKTADGAWCPGYDYCATPKQQCEQKAAELGKEFTVKEFSNGAPAGCVKYNNVHWVETCSGNTDICGTTNCNGCTVLNTGTISNAENDANGDLCPSTNDDDTCATTAIVSLDSSAVQQANLTRNQVTENTIQEGIDISISALPTMIAPTSCES
jgi:hypothetical protein